MAWCGHDPLIKSDCGICRCEHVQPLNSCALCHKAANQARWRIHWKITNPTVSVGKTVEMATPDCHFLGQPVVGNEREQLELDHRKDWHRCEHEQKPLGEYVCQCKGCGRDCPGFVAEGSFPERVLPVGPAGLAKGSSGFAFNASLFRYQDRLLLAYRTDWAGAHCHIAEVDEDYTPKRTVVLPELRHPHANYGREDPRLFLFRGRLHISFIGVEGSGSGRAIGRRKSIHTNQLYARLTDDLRVEEVFYPHYPRRRGWEKNWSFFDWEGELFAVYSIAPHVVLHIRGNHAYPFAETQTEFPWSGGHLRGGAAPVRIGDEYWHWFHGRTDSDRRYNVGLYTFEAKPPFRIKAMSPDPLLWADTHQTDGNYCAVVFPCGAVLDGDTWRVSMGWNDRSIRIAEWNHQEITTLLNQTDLSNQHI